MATTGRDCLGWICSPSAGGLQRGLLAWGVAEAQRTAAVARIVCEVAGREDAAVGETLGMLAQDRALAACMRNVTLRDVRAMSCILQLESPSW